MAVVTYTQLPSSITGNRTVYVDSRIAANVIQLCRQFGVSAYSGRRFEPGSDHNCGAAVDFVGDDSAQRMLYDYANSSGKFAYVEPWASSHTIGVLGTTGPHVHISFFRCGQNPGNSTVSKTFPSNKLSYSQIKEIWIRNGGSKVLAPTMAGIALAESTGDPRAHCLDCVPGVIEDSRGLWQINVDPSANPEYASWNLYNPDTNALAAIQLAHGGKGLSNWSTYKNGSFLKNIPSNESGIFGGIPTKGLGNIITGIESGIGSGINALPFPGLGGIPWGPNVGPKNPIAKAAGIPGDIAGAIEWAGREIVYVMILMAGGTAIIVGLLMIGLDIGVSSRAGKAVESKIPGAKFTRTKIQSKTQRKPVYDPSVENRKAYVTGVRAGERAKAKKQGYQEGKEGNVVSIRSKQGETKTLVVPSQRQARNERLKRESKKYGKRPF